MEYSNGFEYKKPNWMILKEAAEKLAKSGKRTFTRKELTRFAKQIDPSRPITSLDFEIDLVTVNSNSKDRYRTPEKLFLFRVGRGRYTLYDPEVHGPIEKYMDNQWYFPTRRQVLRSVVEQLERQGYRVDVVKQVHKPLSPDLIAEKNGARIGIWIVDPGSDKSTQLKTLAYAVGSALLNAYDEALITLPPELLSRIPAELKDLLRSRGIKLVPLREEKRYVIVF